MTRLRPARVATVMALLGVLLAGCSGSSGAAPSPDHETTQETTQQTTQSTTQPDPTVSAAAYRLPTCPDLPHRAAVRGGLPDLTLPCLGGGRSVRLADLRGTPTVLNVWAAWCPPCAEEMPVLADGMHRAGDRVQFFGVHYKAPEKYGEQSAKDFGVAFPSVQDTDGDETVLALRATAPPQTFFYAADGTLAGRHLGAVTTRAELDDLVQQYLGVRL